MQHSQIKQLYTRGGIVVNTKIDTKPIDEQKDEVIPVSGTLDACLLYTSDAADD